MPTPRGPHGNAPRFLALGDARGIVTRRAETRHPGFGDLRGSASAANRARPAMPDAHKPMMAKKCRLLVLVLKVAEKGPNENEKTEKAAR
jgi:hypothetical protein